MNEMVYLNGVFLNRTEAKISPDDRGFHFADGVYEVVKYYQGKPFRMEDHIRRLQNSLNETRINYCQSDELPPVFNELLELNDLKQQDAGVYLQISRGSSQRVHHFPDNLSPTVYAFAFPFPLMTSGGCGAILNLSVYCPIPCFTSRLLNKGQGSVS
jgi:D-alanine transaminase